MGPEVGCPSCDPGPSRFLRARSAAVRAARGQRSLSGAGSLLDAHLEACRDRPAWTESTEWYLEGVCIGSWKLRVS